jgi:hypothetical protein
MVSQCMELAMKGCYAAMIWLLGLITSEPGVGPH